MDTSELETASLDESPPRRRSAEHYVLLAFAAIGVLGLVALRLLVVPDERGFGTHEQLGFMPCYPLRAYDFPCPGCGVTTSVSYAIRGDVVASIFAQPLGFLLAAGAPVFAGWAAWAHFRGRDVWWELNRPNWTRWGIVGLGTIALSWIYKILSVRGLF